jgi:GLPGLI family protein
MKKLLLILIAVSCVFGANAQYVPPFETIRLNNFTVLDSAQLKFTYNFSYKKSFCKNEADTAFVVDKQSLLIGKNVSKYYSQYYLDYCERAMKKNYETELEESACSIEIFKNYPANKTTVIEQAGHHILGGFDLYSEDTPKFKWIIRKDTTTMLGYACQKATTTFRGRNYTAWFAPEIPLNNGPWKFGGLPGLILKIYDDNRNFTFVCSGIQQLEKPEKIKLFTMNYTKVTRQQMDKVYKRYSKDPMQFWKDIHSKMVEDLSGTGFVTPKLTYNPIELE